MQEIQALAATCRVATAHDVVLNTECCYTFHTPYTSDAGIVVNLQTFMGTVEELALRDGADKQLFVRIVKKRVAKEPKDGEEAPAAPTKLAIGVEGGFAAEEDKYETFATNSIVVLQKGSPPSVVVEVPYADDTKADFPTMVASAADAILCHVGMTTQQEVKVWQADETIPVSKYAADLPFVDNGVMIDPSPSSWKCQKSGATENLWLNLVRECSGNMFNVTTFSNCAFSSRTALLVEAARIGTARVAPTERSSITKRRVKNIHSWSNSGPLPATWTRPTATRTPAMKTDRSRYPILRNSCRSVASKCRRCKRRSSRRPSWKSS